MITIDITVVIQIINILILIVVMNAVLYKPVRAVLAKRKEKLAELANSIETFKKNAELRKEEIEKARSAAQTSTAESLAQVRQEALANKTAQLDEIKKQFTDAQQQLSGQIDSFASDMAAKILGRSI